MTHYNAGYLPYSIVDGFQQLRKDFLLAGASLTKAIETTAETPEERAWFEADGRFKRVNKFATPSVQA